MTEGRLCQVLLLDDRKLELLVQPKLLSYELLDLVSSHFNLKEKEFFGLAFFDDNGQRKWLQMDRRVLEHDFSKKSGSIALSFLVRFYVENITQLKDIITVELFFLNAKSAVYNEVIEVESDNVFKLAANALQEAKGDYTSDENTRADLKKLPTLPTKVLKEHPSLAYCEDRVIEHYKQLKGVSRGQAIVQYLTLVESLPTYGVHYYEVKDKQGIPWWLGLSYKGIGQYDLQDKLKPRKLYQWKQLENLYFREKKFAVEVNDPHRRAVTKRTFGQTGLLIHTWYASHSLIKTIWVMAISQHQFYLDRKQSKAKLGTARSLEELAMDLTEHGGAKINRLGDALKNNLITASNGSLVSTGSADSEMSEEQKKEKLSELRKKEQEIQDILAKKTKELKKICLREAELTGKLPKEYPLSSGERPPQVRRRVGTAFKLDDLFPYNEDPFLRNLESRFALQQKIVEAAKKLANESELCKTVKKKRRRNCLDAMHKLQQIEDEMNQYRIKKGKKPTQRASVIIADELIRSDCSSLSSLPLDDDDSDSASLRPRSRSVQGSPQLSPMRSLGTEYDAERPRENHHNKNHSRLAFEGQEAPHCYQNPREVSSTHSSPYKTLPRPPRDPRSMPPTPVMTRNAYSSSQLRSEGSPHCFRHRSGSLESQPHIRKDTDSEKPIFILSPAHRSNSTEVLEDCSSYTSQSSLDYCGATNSHYSTLDSRNSTMHRLHRKVEVYGNTGSMPNLVQHHAGCNYSCETPAHYAPSAYYVPGYPSPDMEPYANGAYVYENDVEGHYNVNPSYQMNGYHGHDRFRHYSSDRADGLSQNPYATVRPPRTREGPRTELLAKNMQKALVAEHLKGWYHRNKGHSREGGRGMLAGYDYDNGSQLSLGYQTMPAGFSHSSRTTSFSSVSSVESSGNWRNQLAVGLTEYDSPDTPHYPHPGAHPSPYNRSPTHRCSPDNKVSEKMPKKSESVEVVGSEANSADEPTDNHSST
ncbi:FERM domain-containing protein 4B-like isoform X1 [Xyrichtys novacula]|uniref:FERM domain-containing protein 4B-like isoform X1 n=1 Tax=Xyrichtys novacula TaxID=13765 RepID=A0AAV1HIX5_XYRNO|nr:FERM domain-containing protein 4B-like isoform X1 [Xyrichtys novacula]